MTLQERFEKYLRKHGDQWINRGHLVKLARDNGYPDSLINSTLKKLEHRVNIGALWNSEKRRMEYRGYPVQEGDDWMQKVVDEF